MSRVGRHRPIRTCVGCGERAPQASLLRIQASDRLRVEPVAAPGPGRSAYVHRDETCLGRLAKGKLLRRSLRREIDPSVRYDLAARLGNIE